MPCAGFERLRDVCITLERFYKRRLELDQCTRQEAYLMCVYAWPSVVRDKEYAPGVTAKAAKVRMSTFFIFLSFL